jgi:hypothetical protein
VSPSHRVNIKHFLGFCVLGLLVSSSQFAKAGQAASQNLNVSVVVQPSCGVSTERGAAGAEFDAGCPVYVKQSLVRDFVVSGERGKTATEQLVMVINF